MVKFYASVRITLAKEFPDHFGIEIETNPVKPLKDMSKQEYDDYKDNLVKERDMIRKGKERVREKIKGIRHDFSKAVVKGSRSGNGKIVYEHWDTLISIWGGSPSTQSLQFGVESHDFSFLANLESMDNINLTNSDSDLVPESHCSPVHPSSSELSESHINSSNVSEITCGTGSGESTSSGRSGKRKTSPCPALIDQKRKHLEK